MKHDFYRKVWSSIWHEPWSDDVRMVAIYLLTCEHSSNEGIYRMPLEYAPPDLKWPPKRFRAAFEELLQTGFVEYDHDAHVVLIVKALKRNKPNENQIKSILKALRGFSQSHLIGRFGVLAEEHAPPLAEALAKDFPEAFPKSSS